MRCQIDGSEPPKRRTEGFEVILEQDSNELEDSGTERQVVGASTRSKTDVMLLIRNKSGHDRKHSRKDHHQVVVSENFEVQSYLPTKKLILLSTQRSTLRLFASYTNLPSSLIPSTLHLRHYLDVVVATNSRGTVLIGRATGIIGTAATVAALRSNRNDLAVVRNQDS